MDKQNFVVPELWFWSHNKGNGFWSKVDWDDHKPTKQEFYDHVAFCADDGSPVVIGANPDPKE